MRIVKTVYMIKGERERSYDIEKNQQGFSIQRNGYTLTGRISTQYGANEVLISYVEDDKKRGWSIERERQVENLDDIGCQG